MVVIIYSSENIAKRIAGIEILDGYYGGNSPSYNFGSFIGGFEYSTGIQVAPDWLKP